MSELILMLLLRRRFLPGSNVLDTKSRQWKCGTFALFTFFSKRPYMQGRRVALVELVTGDRCLEVNWDGKETQG